MNVLSRLSFLLLFAFLLANCSGPSQAASPISSTSQVKSPGLGIAITPKNFPKHTMTDIDEAFRMARELGDYAVFIYQWGDLNLETAKLMMGKSRQVGLIPILGLSPTTLDKERKELDLPDSVQRKAGSNISFKNPVIRKAFKESAKDLARLEPPYLCLATEINFLALQRLTEYLHFASLYKEVYREVKRISPRTKVFVSFQWEWIRILDAKEPERIKEHTKVIDIFRPELDVIGLTTYPSPFHNSPADLPRDYYSWMDHHIKRTDEIFFMEVGWPTTGTGNEQEQADFIRRLPGLLKGINFNIVAWALLHDVTLAEFDANLNTVGLVTNNGQRKPAYDTFMSLKELLTRKP
jgi:hypothetical protein